MLTLIGQVIATMIIHKIKKYTEKKQKTNKLKFTKIMMSTKFQISLLTNTDHNNEIFYGLVSLVNLALRDTLGFGPTIVSIE